MRGCKICGSVHATDETVAQHIFMSETGEHAELNDKTEIMQARDEYIETVDIQSYSDETTETMEFPEADSMTDEPDEPDEPNEAPEEQDDQIKLPCDHESFSKSEAPEPPFEVACETCSGTWTVRDV